MARHASCQHSLHLIEHGRHGALDPQSFLDLIGGRIRVFRILQEAGALMFPEKLVHAGTLPCQFSGNPSRFVNTVVMPVEAKSATASSMYLSKSVSKMP